jgi:RHS repeat-associated protein
VTFFQTGIYQLQLSANDGVSTSTDFVTVFVDSQPSLAGANLNLVASNPGPLVDGTALTLTATLLDSAAHPIPSVAVKFDVAGANAQSAYAATNASGIAYYTYTGANVGTDVVTATALGAGGTPTSTLPGITWLPAPPSGPPVVTQGWIGSPTHQSTVTGQMPITIGSGVTLTSGTVTYWPMSAPDQVHTLATNAAGGPGATVATLDATVLANGPWTIKLDGTDDQGHSQVSEVAVTVSGDYKPGRVVVEVTDLTIPAMGMPVSVGRRYDSLEKDNVGDFGHGWSLTLGHPRLETDPAHNVTLTMPDGRRVTFYFQANSVTPSALFAWLYGPGYVPEPGVFGSLTADGCPLMVQSAGQLVCFLEASLEYAPTTYKYTDPYGKVYTMSASGELRSIKDIQQNELTFTPSGITSNTGVSVTFERDAQGRITKVSSPALDSGNATIVHGYEYSSDGDLSKCVFPDSSNIQYTYDTDHRLQKTIDNNGNVARTSTYDTAGHLLTDTDALGNLTSYAYDIDGHKTTISNPDNGVVVRTFDDNGLLLEEIDPLGRTAEHTYDANKNELTQKNALGEVTTFAYDTHGNRTSRTNARGEAIQVSYDQFSQPLARTDPSGRNLTMAYDGLGALARISDALGTVATFTTSEHGLPLTSTDATGRSSFLAYDSYGNLTSRVDRLGRTTRYTYDGVGRQTSETNPRGGVTSYGYLPRGPRFKATIPTNGAGGESFSWNYDANLNIIHNDSDSGRGRDYVYDALNNLTKITFLGLGTSVEYTRDFRGNPLTMKDESGRTTTFEYDKAGQLQKMTFPDGTFTTTAYDQLGRVVTATDERGNSTSYEYESGCNCADRVTKVTDPLGRATTTAYDASGRRAAVTDAAGHTTSYAYDVRGHLIKTTYADGTSELDTYDTSGRRTSHTDQMGALTQYGYDAEGQLISVTDALSNVTRYAYDDDGNLASVTDANNHTSTYSYDLVDRKTARTLPLGATETFAYDMFGEPTSHVDFRGKTTTLTYDARGRLISKVPDPTLGEPTVSFTYNPTGTRATMSDATGTTAYAYDARDRLLTKATPPATQTGTLSYTYDPTGNLATIRSSNPNGTSVDYAWDAAKQLVSVTDNRVGGETTSAYTPTGRASLTTLPSGVAARYLYDARDRVTTLAWARGTEEAFGSWSYGYNDRGQRTTATDVTGRQVAYGFDAIARLTSETVSNDPQGAADNGQVSYTLDAAGNRLTRTSTLAALGTQSFSYDANDQLTTDTYDANGNTTASDGHTYKYDFENRLVGKDNGVVSIAYDGDGNRVAKTVGGVTTRYLVDDLNPTGYLQVLEEVSGGAVQVAYTYGTMLVSQRRVATGGTVTYYGYGARGDIAFLTDATGAVTDSYDYDAWGNLVAHSGSTPNTRLFGGEELDPNLGLINLRARQYWPGTGRLGTLDPAMGMTRYPITFNRYLYANGDPIDLKDPSGRFDYFEGFGLTKLNAAIGAVNVVVGYGLESYSDQGFARTFGRDILMAGLVAEAIAGVGALLPPLPGMAVEVVALAANSVGLSMTWSYIEEAFLF